MARRLGGQVPTFQNVGEYASSRGADAVAMFEAYGRNYYDSQRYEMEVFFARNERGDFAAKTICITKPRQNGKSFAARDYAIWMACVEHKNVLYSAHRSGVAHKMFKEIADFVRGNADLYAEVDTIYAAIGYEGIYFCDGSYIEFQTRTSGVRGGTYSVLILDEAQELTAAQQDAILPTVSAAEELDEDAEDKSQKIYIGTVPGPECNGTIFQAMHDKAHAGSPSIWWLEWGAQGDTLQDVDIDSVDLWYACNPAMGRRMSERTVRDEHDTMTRDGFARERLGWWSPTAVRKNEHIIDAAAWDACATDHPLDPERTCYGVKFAADGSEVMLAVAESRGDVTHVELQERRPMSSGTAWLADWLCERTNVGCCVVVDGRSGSQALVERMSDRAPRGFVVTPSSGDVVAAASMLCDAVSERRLTWYSPQEQLRESAVTATRRAIGRGGGWGFGGADPLPIEACALALWGSRTTKRNPNRKARIG